LIGDADHFWQKRYYDFNVRDHEQFVEKLHYIHCNPVKKELCERPEDWEWSSFLHHATGREGRIEIESEWTARQRERAAGRLCSAVELPHSPRAWLSPVTWSISVPRGTHPLSRWGNRTEPILNIALAHETVVALEQSR
jgi:hypothetical protein